MTDSAMRAILRSAWPATSTQTTWCAPSISTSRTFARSPPAVDTRTASGRTPSLTIMASI